jgi:hypothetical protein
MLTFDASAVIVTDKNEILIQLVAMGQNSGYPAYGNLNAMKRLRDQLTEAIGEVELRASGNGSNVVCIKKHG